MEERQTKIREGAGLEESRLNVEFIDLLKKYSTPLMLVLILVAGGYFLWNYYKKAHEKGIDDAFSQFDAAAKSLNPTSLVRVADEQNRLIVPYISRLAAADIHLDAARSGVPIGTTPDPQNPGKLPEGTTALTAEQRTEEIGKAEALYKQVLDATKGDDNLFIQAVSALNGLAACAEMRGQTDAARGFYQQVIDMAKKAKVDDIAFVAQKMIDSLDSVKNPPKLYSEASLPKSAAEMQPFVSPMQNIKMIGADGKEIDPNGGGGGSPIQVTPIPAPAGAPGTTPPAPAPTPSPTPAPAPPASPAPAPAGGGDNGPK